MIVRLIRHLSARTAKGPGLAPHIPMPEPIAAAPQLTPADREALDFIAGGMAENGYASDAIAQGRNLADALRRCYPRSTDAQLLAWWLPRLHTAEWAARHAGGWDGRLAHALEVFEAAAHDLAGSGRL